MKRKKIAAFTLTAAMFLSMTGEAFAAAVSASDAPLPAAVVSQTDTADGTVTRSADAKAAQASGETNSLGKAVWYTSENTDYRSSFSSGNVGGQDYHVSSEPINSYLTLCDDGRLMKFEAPEAEYYFHDGSYDKFDFRYLVEYYDKDYNLLSSRRIAEELPVFGGFYSTKDYYYLVTGQYNRDESDDLEVIRVTKYDKNWKRLSSSALRQADTYIPFDAGCVRFEEYDNILFIRTAHEMYDHGDGKHHQSNFTVLYNMQTGETDRYVFGQSDPLGYVSHSFNQFIQKDGSSMIAVDHGDAYPRAVVLKKGAIPSFGNHGWNYPASTHIIDIPGSLGQNHTGVTVGGLEISDSAYLVAGSMVNDLDNYQEYYSTKNIYVAAVSKDLKSVTVKNLTNFTDDEGGVTTPHLVKIANNRFLLLYQKKGVPDSIEPSASRFLSDSVCYVELDGNGNPVGKTHEVYGALSDCVPIIAGQKLVWYTWLSYGTIFYEIDLHDLSGFRSQLLVNGKKYDFKHTQEKGKLIESDYLGNAVKYDLYDNGNLYIYGWGEMDIFSRQFNNDTRVKHVYIEPLVTTLPSLFDGCTELESVSLPDTLCFMYGGFRSCSNLKYVTIPANVVQTNSYPFNGCSQITDIYFGGTQQQWKNLTDRMNSTGLKSSVNIHYNYVGTPITITSQSADVTAKVGANVTFSVEAQGDGLKYQWYYKKAGQSAWSKWNGRTTAATTAAANATWNGMQVYCKITDSYGHTADSAPVSITVTQNLKITRQPVSQSVKPGNAVTLSVQAEGIGLRYQWYYKKAGQSAWSKWNGHTQATETAMPNAGWDGIQLYCAVTDAAGKTVNSSAAKITLTQTTVKITSQPVSQSVRLGSTVTLSVKAEGSGLTYQWYYKKAGAAAWSKWNGHTHAAETVTPNAGWNGIQLYCAVTDAAGKTVNSSAAKITLTQGLTITRQPQSQTVKPGNAVTLSVKAEGSGLTYQWYYKKAGAAAWSKWNGRTRATETVTPNASWNGIQLYCVVKDSSGQAMNSNTAKITLTQGLTVTQQPADRYIVLGDTIKLTVKAEGLGLTYQWYYKKAGAAAWSKWNGRTHATETVTPNAGWNGIQLYCAVTDATGKTVNSSAAKITVN